MNKLSFAVIIAASALVNGAALAQSTFNRDLALARLVDARDMSTGLARNDANGQATSPNARFVARGALTQDIVSPAANARDREIWRLTTERDQSTSLAK